MTTFKEKYIGEALLKEKPKKRINLTLKDKAVTYEKLADDLKPIMDKGGFIVMCTHFYTERQDEEELSKLNIGRTGFCIFNGDELLYKSCERTEDDGIKAVYTHRDLLETKIYVDMETDLCYRWNGSNMEVLNVDSLTDDDINDIIDGVYTQVSDNKVTTSSASSMKLKAVNNLNAVQATAVKVSEVQENKVKKTKIEIINL